MDLTLQWLAGAFVVSLLAQEAGPALAPSNSPPLAEEVRQTHPLPGEGRLRIENRSGHLHLIGWDREEVQLVAVKRARTAAALSAVRLEVAVSADELRITTRQPPNHPARVDYTLHMPRRTRVEKASTVSGEVLVKSVWGQVTGSSVNSSVKATDVGGDIRLRSVNGQVEASVAHVTAGQTVDLATVNGSVLLALPAEAAPSFSAMTMNGVITTGFPVKVEPRFPAGGVLLDKVGDGTVKVLAKTVNGDVRLAKGEEFGNE